MHSRSSFLVVEGETMPHLLAVLLNEPDAYCGYTSASKSATSTISKHGTPGGAPHASAARGSFQRIACCRRRPFWVISSALPKERMRKRRSRNGTSCPEYAFVNLPFSGE